MNSSPIKFLKLLWRGDKITQKAEIIAEPGKQEFIIKRVFDAPREVVFKAFIDPALYAEWLGPKGYATNLEVFEPVDGGSWRYTQKDPEGNQFSFHGVNHEVTAPEFIISTFEFDNLPEKGHVILQKAVFKTLPDERTEYTSKSVCLSVEDRDGILQSGMEEGVNESYARLDKILEKIKNE